VIHNYRHIENDGMLPLKRAIAENLKHGIALAVNVGYQCPCLA
jgi:hypothetical protein